MSAIHRLLGLVGISLRQLASDRARTLFAVLGVASAVLAVTLLFGVGAGVVETGTELTERAEFDLWVSGGPLEVNPSAVGGFRNPVTDSHTVAAEIESHEGVQTALPMAFQAVYVSADGERFEIRLGIGVSGDGPLVELDEGAGFSGGDTHYANGSYDGPMTQQAIIDPETAAEYNLSVGDSLYVGGTINNAQENEVKVVGISPTFREFHQTNTVTLRLSELQTLTGSAHNDRATLITVRLEDGADRATVQQELAERYPEFDVRTNQEQMTAVLERQALVIAGGVGLVGLAVLAGMFLSLNLLLSLIYQQRLEIAVFRAIGGSRASIVTVSLIQAMAIATLGCVVGLAVTPVAAETLEWIARTVTGFEGLVQVPRIAYGVGAGVAMVFGLLGAIIGSWRTARHSSVTALTQ